MRMDKREIRPNFSDFLQQRHKQARQASLEASRRRRLLKGLGPVFHKYGISRAYAFGSVLTKACRQDSDLDLYVEDLQPEQYWELWKELENQTGERVDLYCQRDEPRFIQKIKERGRLIYEA